MLILFQGEADCIVKDKGVTRTLKAGESFGEQALYEDAKRGATIRAKTDCKCIALSRKDLQNIMGDKIQQVIQGNWSRWAIEKDDIFKQLTKLQIERWIVNTEVSKVRKDDIILESGSQLTKIVIVLNGSLLYGTTTYEKGRVFDSRFLYPQTNINRPLLFPLIVSSDTADISMIETSKFQSLIGTNLEQVFTNNLTSHEAKMLDDNKDFRKLVENMTLNDLIFIIKLGEGQFGHVLLVVAKGTKNRYALKAISKTQIVNEGLDKHTLQEKEVLMQVNFPFIMQLYRTFKDDYFVYFLLSYVEGMELFDVIRKMGRFGLIKICLTTLSLSSTSGL
jgi:cGMP-dependent protein kinase